MSPSPAIKPIVEFEERRAPAGTRERDRRPTRYNPRRRRTTDIALEPRTPDSPGGPPRRRPRVSGKHHPRLHLRARVQGLRFLELDVHLSADGVPIVIHDHHLKRTTGRPGVRVRSARRASSRRSMLASRQRFGDRFRGTRIPLLTRCAGAAQRSPRSHAVRRDQARQPYSFRPRAGGLTRWSTRCKPARSAVRGDLVRSGGRASGAPDRRRADRLGVEQATTSPLAPGSSRRCSRSSCSAITRMRCHPEEGALWRGPWRWAVYEVENIGAGAATGRARRPLHRDHGGARDEPGDTRGSTASR